jgi:hypothetical protein
MSPGKGIKTTLVGSIFVLLCAVCALDFVRLAPWIACKPISELSKKEAVVAQIPASARCYSINHGQIVFHKHGTIAEDTRSFVLRAAVFVIALGLLFCAPLWNALLVWALGPGDRHSQALRSVANIFRRHR